MKLTTLALTVIATTACVAPAFAQVVAFDNYEGATATGGDRFFSTDGQPGSTVTFSGPGEPAIGTQSVKLGLTDLANATTVYLDSIGATNGDLTPPVAGAFGKLRDVVGSYQFQITQTPNNGAAPYMFYWIDNGGGADFTTAIVDFESGPGGVSGTFLAEGLDATSLIHVDGNNRGALTAGQFSSSNGGGTMSDLYNTEFSTGLLFGDLDVYSVGVQAGAQGGVGQFTAFIDNVSIAVPEPTSLLALAGAGVLGLRRRQN